jgi:hypothetical protein
MGPLVLAKNFLMVSAANQVFVGDWLPFDSEFQNATIHVHCQTLSPASPSNGYDVIVQTSFDRVEAYQVGTTISLTATGSRNAGVAANIGPWVRLRIENVEGAAMVALVSVWLQVKSA